MPGIDYTIGLKAGGFNRGAASAMGELKKIGTAAAKITATAGLAAGVGMGAAIFKGINAAAARETLETAFIPLLGSVKAAQDRMAELASFAASTPFEMPEIATASRTLQTLTKGALSTGDGLTLVGDVAAGANQSFAEVAVTIGRLHDALQNNRPAGEALQRLQEIGAVSGDVRGQIEKLTDSGMGADGWKLAAAELGKFTGSMELQSGTWNGLVSTLQDAWNELWVSFGKPIMDQVKPFLDAAIKKMEELRDTAADVGTRVGEVFGTLRKSFEEGSTFKLIGAQLQVAFAKAVNFLAKGLTAAVTGIGAALEASGVLKAFQALAKAVGRQITIAILEGIDSIPGMNKSKEIERQEFLQSGDLAAFQVALKSFDPDKTFAAGSEAFQNSWQNQPDLPMVGAAEANYEKIAGPLRDAALADIEARKKAREELAKEIEQRKKAATEGLPTAPTSPAAAAAAQIPGRGGAAAGPNWLERLGFLGGGLNPRTGNAAERQASLAQRQVTILSRIESHLSTREPQAAAF